ncbi:N-acetylglucosamine kinase [Streptomyces sp. NPDC059175]|uniref:N-acetylglucosamine kinase n=1 Tax=Streptomyces sp. NPDC059175 TaxID=3346757 RepID=UPI0036D0CF1E
MGVNAAVLAIDAGNSKTDVAVVGPDGSLLGTARGGGFQPQRTGVGAAFDALGTTVERALARAGARHAEHVSACLAGADLPPEEAELSTALRARAWGVTSTARNDTFAVLRAGTDEPRGVAVVCGAGINCVGLLPDGRTARFPAVGTISGDWGGGAGLADEALWFAARADDGRGDPTQLARTLPRHFGMPTMYALIEALHLRHIPASRKQELTPVLFATSEGGDAVAQAIVDRLADEVVALSVVALGQLGLSDEAAPVVLGGAVLAARHPRLDAGIVERLAVRAPHADLTVVTAPPVLGAALLGLDHLGVPAPPQARLRAHFGRVPWSP